MALYQSVKLPRFILLHGSYDATYAFTEELIDNHLPNDAAVLCLDFKGPLLDGIASMFYGGPSLDVNMAAPSFRNGPLELTNTRLSVSEFLNAQADLVRKLMGSNILARIIAREHQQSGYHELCDNIIIRDHDNTSDGDFLVGAFGTNSCCCVKLGSLVEQFDPGGAMPTYWCPNTSAKTQCEYFLHSITTISQRSNVS